MAPRKKNNVQERISQLLSMAWNTKSKARILSIVEQILEISPDYTEALLLKADNIQDPDEQIKILTQAINSLDTPGNCNPEDHDVLYFALSQRLAYVLFSNSHYDKTLECCESALKFIAGHQELIDENENEYNDLKALYYRSLIQKREWKRILSETMKDEDKTLGRAYAKLIAAWVSSPVEKRKNICAGIFWDALIMAPDVPFYILGFFDEPEDEYSQAGVEFSFALMYYDTISISDDLYTWFSRGVILFGLLSGRFENDEYDYMIDVLDNFGGFIDYQRMKNIITSTEDAQVIETLAANKCLID